jgi:hypothetical protein
MNNFKLKKGGSSKLEKRKGCGMVLLRPGGAFASVYSLSVWQRHALWRFVFLVLI